MKLSNKVKSILDIKEFDIEFESKMVQARILSTILEIIDDRDLTQKDLEKMTGLKQSFLSGLLNQNRNLSMKHIALFQNALNIRLQPPSYLALEDHNDKFYSETDYEPAHTCFPDIDYLKEETFITWINPLLEEQKNELKSYYTIQSKNWEKVSNEKAYELNPDEIGSL